MEKTQSLPGREIPVIPVLILSVITAATLLSTLSGYHAFKAPFDLEWQFSPIGLLQGVTPENAAINSQSTFAGNFGLTFDYLVTFLKTCLFEFPFYFACFRRRSFFEIVAILLFANFATHPIVFFVIPALFQKYLSAAIAGEIFAPAIEMLIAYALLRETSDRKQAAKGALWILAANLFSWELGMFV